MPQNRPYSLSGDLPITMKTVHFVADRTAAFAAQALSMEPWQGWIPKAVPPFEDMLIEWRPLDMVEAMAQRADASFLKASFHDVVRMPGQVIVPARIESRPDTDDLFAVEGMLVSGNTITFHAGSSPNSSSGMRRTSITLPFEVRVGEPRDAEDPSQRTLEELIWGSGYEKVMGSYPNIRVTASRLRGAPAEIRKGLRHVSFRGAQTVLLPDMGLVEFAGVARFGMAILALINAERHNEIIIAESTKTFRGNMRRLPAMRLVVIRPDTVRRVYTAQDDSPESCVARREHGVRRHLRRYKSGRTTWVREHVRGDASLGSIKKRYIVEMDPNKEMQ